MDRIPPSAAVNEAVKCVRAVGQDRASGYVNGTLRTIARKWESLGDEPGSRLDRAAEAWQNFPTGDEGLSVRHSCPLPLIQLWRDGYGDVTARTLVAHLGDRPPAVLRLNTLRITPEEWDALAQAAGISYHVHESLPACVVADSGLTDGETGKRLDFLEEKCYYQDVASQWCVKALDPQPGDRVADVCAAPGGKTLTAAQYMKNHGVILSGDVHADKADALSERARRMGATIVETVARDASAPCPKPLESAFDRVLCDVPCSGLGVIRRKPEIRYKPLPGDDLPDLQYRILAESAKMVKPGGVLQYSTCTLNPAENEAVVERFLQSHPAFAPRVLPMDAMFAKSGLTPDARITLLPPVHGTDGFFIAGFVRKDGDRV
ncbi:MAG: 16S rRNA (cytosine(967)-C(5))-methyltransferase RsmB, partial [Clostridia bacterium]|nr:16S rRNA (cytosine(967)-C(5))-methyltransferase RsmB [Clostridia bacterium]